MARSLTRREDWPRDAVGVRRPGGDQLPRPDDQLAKTPQKRPLPWPVSTGLLEPPVRMPRRCIRPSPDAEI
jgi:hypothetical protein